MCHVAGVVCNVAGAIERNVSEQLLSAIFQVQLCAMLPSRINFAVKLLETIAGNMVQFTD